jgi:hypothetical protein
MAMLKIKLHSDAVITSFTSIPHIKLLIIRLFMHVISTSDVI